MRLDSRCGTDTNDPLVVEELVQSRARGSTIRRFTSSLEFPASWSDERSTRFTLPIWIARMRLSQEIDFCAIGHDLPWTFEILKETSL